MLASERQVEKPEAPAKPRSRIRQNLDVATVARRWEPPSANLRNPKSGDIGYGNPS